MSAQKALEVFISYSKRDRDALERLMKDIEPRLVAMGMDAFYDVKLVPGAHWDVELEHRLERAAVVLFLVSAHWLASDFCQRELQACLNRQKRALMVPIILSPCAWQDSEVGRFVALPRGGKPIDTWSSRDEVLDDLVSGLGHAVDEFRERFAGPGMLAHAKARHAGRVTTIVGSTSGDGRHAVSASEDGSVVFWDLLTMTPFATQFIRAGLVDLALLGSSKTQVVAQADNELCFSPLEPWSSARQTIGLPGKPARISASEDLVAVRLASGEVVCVRRAGSSWRLFSLPGTATTALHVVGRRLLRAVEEGLCEWWDVRDEPRLISTSRAAASPIRHLVALERVDLCLSGCESGHLQVFDANGVKRDFVVSRAPINGIAALKDARHAVLACVEGLRLFDLTRGVLIRELTFSDDEPTAVDVTPDDRRVIWGSARGKVSAWPVDTTPVSVLPEGRPRLELAYLAVLERPDLWSLLETLDEHALHGIGAQLAVPPEQDVLQFLRARHPGKLPPALWAAWIETLHASRLGQETRLV
jgi:WD40 repeat protein